MSEVGPVGPADCDAAEDLWLEPAVSAAVVEGLVVVGAELLGAV
jgi:hypothetical protein